MTALPQRIKLLRQKAGLTQEEFGNIFGIVKSTVSLYESGKSTPNDEIKMKICKHFNVSIDYLLGLDKTESPKDVFDYHGGDAEAVTFRQKLINQLTYEGKGIQEISSFLNISEDIILDWLNPDGTDDSYRNYYKQLSEFFSVNERYWTSPGAISPGIEPNAEEYDLILVKRKYNETGKISSPYGDLQKFFPSVRISESEDELFMIDSYRQMNQDSKEIIRGQMKQVLRDQRRDESLGNAASAK